MVDRKHCLNAGMDGYISKPIRAEKLFQAIDALFIGAKEPGDTSSFSATAQDTADSVDWPEALKSVGGDPVLLKTVIEAALQEVPRLMAALAEAAAAGDATAGRLAAHTLRASIRYFGVTRAIQFARQIEAMGGEDNLAGATEILLLLEDEIKVFVRSLSDHLQTSGEPAGLPS